ncbi:MAG: dihydrolipoamide succinyltransferase [Proteobacteria bacterium]|nr:dihydrolipoamide succinyltransferase [Pseudomonadota bacterium]
MSRTAGCVEIRAPSGQEEGTRSQVLRWLKAVGEPVAEHEPLIELETDKVTVEVASPGAGVLTEILKQEQEQVAPGELLGRIGIAAAAGAPGTPAVAAVAAVPEGAVGAPATASREAAIAAAAAAAGSGSPGGAAARQLSPAVRRLLAQHSLDAAKVRGTGEGGRITVADVLREASPSAPGAPQTASRAAAVEGKTDASGADGVAGHRVPHSAVRKRIAARMVESLLHTAPHVTTVFEVDMGEVLAHRQRHREEFARRGVALTLTAYFAQAAVTAIRAVPEANSRWTDTELEIYDTVNLGIATAAQGGLVVPVLQHAESLDLLETARRLEDLVRRARDGALTPADVRGGTFTLSNHGVSGSLLAAPIIIPQPQSAILGLGKLEKRAVVLEEGAEDRIVARSRCYATLTIDHRVMDGSRANRFLEAFTERLSGWEA